MNPSKDNHFSTLFQSNEFLQISQEYASKLIELKSEKENKERKNQEKSLNLNDTTKKINIFSKHLNSLQTKLEKIRNENQRLYQEIELLKSQNKEIKLSSSIEQLLPILKIIREETHQIKNVICRSENNSNNESANTNLKKLLNQPSRIQGLQHITSLDKINPYNDLWTIIELRDKRLATSDYGSGTISICSLDYNTKKWTQNIKKERIYGGNSVRSLLELSDNRLVSCGGNNCIQVWSILKNDLSLLKTITGHTGHINQVIYLSHNRFASCSEDKTIKIWNSEEPYNEITNLSLESSVYSLLKLKNKEILISSCSLPCIDFWDLNTYQKINCMKGNYAERSSHMIELPNQMIAISSKNCGNSILIIDPNKYAIIKEIKENDYIKSNSSLCVLDNHSFCYACNECLVQVAIKDYNIIFKTKMEKTIGGFGGFITVEGGKYMLIHGKTENVIVIQPYFE